jgi:hypothetical protein
MTLSAFIESFKMKATVADSRHAPPPHLAAMQPRIPNSTRLQPPKSYSSSSTSGPNASSSSAAAAASGPANSSSSLPVVATAAATGIPTLHELSDSQNNSRKPPGAGTSLSSLPTASALALARTISASAPSSTTTAASTIAAAVASTTAAAAASSSKPQQGTKREVPKPGTNC